MARSRAIDALDFRILDALQADAKTLQADIAKRLGLSPAAVHERIRKLEREGLIRRYAAILDDARLGFDVTAFIEVFVSHPRFDRPFLVAMRDLPEVQEVHHVTGEASCLLKIKTRDRASLQALLLGRINTLPGVRGTRTVIVLSTSKEDTRLALGPLGAARVTSGTRRRQR